MIRKSRETRWRCRVTNKWVRFGGKSLAVMALATALVGTAHAGKRTAAPPAARAEGRAVCGAGAGREWAADL